MAYLNANLPPIYCKIRKEYLYDMDKNKRGELDCVIFGLTSISGRALLFNIMLPNGACYWRLPLSAFFQKSFLKNISVHIYWLLITATLQLSLIIVFFGTLIVTLLTTAGLTIKSKLRIGMQRIMKWWLKIRTKCFIKWRKRKNEQ